MELFGLIGGEPDVGIRVRAERQYRVEGSVNADPLEPPHRTRLFVEEPALVGILRHVVRHEDHLRPGNSRARHVLQLVQHLPAPVDLPLPLLAYEFRKSITLYYRINLVAVHLGHPHPPLDALQVQIFPTYWTLKLGPRNDPQAVQVQAILRHVSHTDTYCTHFCPKRESNPEFQDRLYVNTKVNLMRALKYPVGFFAASLRAKVLR